MNSLLINSPYTISFDFNTFPYIKGEKSAINIDDGMDLPFETVIIEMEREKE